MAYVPLASAVFQILFILLIIKDSEKLVIGDDSWRKVSGVLAICTLVCTLLPAYVVRVPNTVTGTASDAEVMNRSVSILQEMLGNEPSLSEIAAEEGVFHEVLGGDLAALRPYYQDTENVRGIFLISSSDSSFNLLLLGGFVLLIAGAILAFASRVDRWFPLAFNLLALCLLTPSVMNFMIVDDGDMYASATRQLGHLGLGNAHCSSNIDVFILCWQCSLQHNVCPYSKFAILCLSNPTEKNTLFDSSISCGIIAGYGVAVEREIFV